MSNKIDNLFKAAREVRLHESEKSEMVSRLSSFMGTHPYTPPKQLFGSFDLLPSFVFHNYQTAFSIVLILALSGGTALASQKALPDETLYSIKVNVTEKVEQLLAVGPEAAASVSMKHALTRLAEAHELAARGRLTEAAEAKVEAQFSRHVADVERETTRLTKSGDTRAVAEIREEFDAALESHALSLLALSSGGDAQGTVPAGEGIAAVELRMAAPSQAEDSAAFQKTAPPEEKPEDKARGGAEQALIAARVAFTSARSVLETSPSTSSIAAARAEASLRLVTAGEFLRRGNLLFDSGSYEEAIVLFSQAERKAHETEVRFLSILHRESDSSRVEKNPLFEDFKKGEENDKKNPDAKTEQGKEERKDQANPPSDIHLEL